MPMTVFKAIQGVNVATDKINSDLTMYVADAKHLTSFDLKRISRY